MKKLVSALLGVSLALGVGEWAAARGDNGGFPHYNGYLPDPALGVRLIPDFDTVLAFKDNPPGAIHVNRQGYRGEDWPEGRTGETVLIGDSQVFGLGVNDGETLAAALAGASGRAVLNLGVPTYGPVEYLALIDEIAAREPSDIVVVLNFANDLFEIDQPNTTRHVVLDGWAVRGAQVPAHVNFPGRAWLFQRSHLVYAARRLLHQGEAEPTTAEATPVAALPTPAAPAVAVSPEEVADAVQSAVSAFEHAEDEVIRALIRADPSRELPYVEEALEVARTGKGVGDIVNVSFAEESVLIQVTADWLRTATRLRREAPDALRAWLQTAPRGEARAQAERALADYDATRADLARIEGLAPQEGGRRSAFRPFLVEAQARARAAGAELTVVALPLDVQVDPEEFKKYGQPPQDLGETLGLLTDLCADARRLGLRCVDPVAALRAQNPGMFLDGDIHLTARGQAVLAGELAAALEESAPSPMPFAGLPEGRSRFPDPSEWEVVPENFVKGSSRNRCRTQQLREYLRVACRDATEGLREGEALAEAREGAPLFVSSDAAAAVRTEVLGLQVIEGPADRRTWARHDESGFVIPMLPERRIVVDFFFSDREERLTVEPGARAEGEPVGTFEPVEATGAPEPTLQNEGQVSKAACAPDQIRGGAALACLDRCDPATACKVGVCTDWLGLGLCI